ncbi:MAG: hypothetical protein GX539_02435 [Candidatus Cloacimonetes bacterium]|jgi:hypothetical protein|nr:hypothetical protein [Candidatus Cloacimonadota bacterium]
MTRRWVNRIAALALAATVMAGVSCGREVAAPQLEPAPTETELLGLGGLLGGLLGPSQIGEYTLVQERLALPLDLDISKIIGINGGSISLLGHTITVPAGAVDRPVLFTLILARPGYVEVELDATISGLLGRIIDVGGKGFDKPVSLTLTYSRATNVSDPSRLVILRRLPGGAIEEVPSTVDTRTKTVTAKLDHFSRYCMAVN